MFVLEMRLQTTEALVSQFEPLMGGLSMTRMCPKVLNRKDYRTVPRLIFCGTPNSDRKDGGFFVGTR
jgi:hypothetical protein